MLVKLISSDPSGTSTCLTLTQHTTYHLALPLSIIAHFSYRNPWFSPNHFLHIGCTTVIYTLLSHLHTSSSPSLPGDSFSLVDNTDQIRVCQYNSGHHSSLSLLARERHPLRLHSLRPGFGAPRSSSEILCTIFPSAKLSSKNRNRTSHYFIHYGSSTIQTAPAGATCFQFHQGFIAGRYEEDGMLDYICS
jgi:hypothetical protein